MSRITRVLAFALIGSAALVALPESASAQFNYQPMENLPGFEGENIADFPTYVVTFYRMAIWLVGLSAMLMIVIGGFMYMSSAGNTSRISTAKTIIWDAIIGLVIALTAWLMLNVINQDLRNLRLNNIQFQRPQFNITVSGVGTGASTSIISPSSNTAINAPATTGVVNQAQTDIQQAQQQFSQGGFWNNVLGAGNTILGAGGVLAAPIVGAAEGVTNGIGTGAGIIYCAFSSTCQNSWDAIRGSLPF